MVHPQVVLHISRALHRPDRRWAGTSSGSFSSEEPKFPRKLMWPDDAASMFSQTSTILKQKRKCTWWTQPGIKGVMCCLCPSSLKRTSNWSEVNTKLLQSSFTAVRLLAGHPLSTGVVLSLLWNDVNMSTWRRFDQTSIEEPPPRTSSAASSLESNWQKICSSSLRITFAKTLRRPLRNTNESLVPGEMCENSEDFQQWGKTEHKRKYSVKHNNLLYAGK